MDKLEWDKIAAFVQIVGVPFACLLIFVGPFIWLFFSLIKKYGPRIADAHVEFMQSATETQKQNAETLAKLEYTSAKDQESHYVTHHAIGLLADAGLAQLDGKTDSARIKLQRVETVLTNQRGLKDV